MKVKESHESIIKMLVAKLSVFMENPEFEAAITADANLIESGMTSIIMVRLIVEIEQHFDITFEDEEMLEGNFVTLNQIATNIMNKRVSGM